MTQHKKDEGILGTGVDERTAMNVAQMGTNLMGKYGNPVGAGLEYVSAGMDRDDSIKQSLAVMGDGTDVHVLKSGSPAFRKYVKELAGLEEERMSNFTVGIIGGAVAMGLAGMIFGLPGGILGMVVGLVIGGAGAMGANMIKEQFWPSQDNTFLSFASQLQQMGEQQQMSPEAAFVALAMNMPDERSKKDILLTLPKKFRLTRVRDMTKLLETDEGREVLRAAMVENDSIVRAGVGAMSVMPNATISEQFAGLVNNGQMAGVDLLNLEKTGHVGTLIAMHEAQAMQQMQQSPQMQNMAQNNPNMQLPHSRTAHNGINP